MKKIIFISLLSLSMCLCQQAGEAAPGTVPHDPLPAPAPKTDTLPSPVPSSTKPDDKTTISNDKTKNVNPPAEKSPEKVTEKPSDKPTDKNPAKNTDKTDKNTDASPAVVTPPIAPASTPGTADKNSTAKNETVLPAIPKPAPEVITPKTNGTAAKTDDATKNDEAKPVLQARGFDGPSFIGGIILTLGLIAIGFMGFKYYKNQTERNYHTL